MNTTSRTLTAVAIALALTACGGGSDDGKAPEVISCETALTNAGVPANMLGFPKTNANIALQADGTHLVWYTQTNPFDGKQTTYASCTSLAQSLQGYTLPDGTAVKVAK